MTDVRELPAAAAELFARAAAAGVTLAPVLRAGPLVVDLGRYEATLDGAPVELTPRQVELLALFLAAPGRVWSREQLHQICWTDVSDGRRVDVQLCRLRAKVGRHLFRTIRDRGWALRVA